MAEDDQTYYQCRAEVETVLAKRSTVLAVGKAHHEMAKAYLDKLAKTGLPQASTS